MNYVVMDTSNSTWLSVCVRNMQDFALAAFYMEAYKSKFYCVDYILYSVIINVEFHLLFQHYSRILLAIPKLFQHNVRMPIHTVF